MCACAASGAACAAICAAVDESDAAAAGRACSSAARSSMGSPSALSSASFATYTPLVSSSPSSYSQSSVSLRSFENCSATAGSAKGANASETFERIEYTYSSTAFLRSFVSSITRSCSAMSYSSCTNVSRTCAGRPPTTLETGTSVRMVFLTILVVSMGSPSGGSSPSAGAGAGTVTSSSISSTACADSTETSPLRLRRIATLSLVLPSGSLHFGTGPISNAPMFVSALGGSSVGVVYLACTPKVSLRKNVIVLSDGTALLRSNSSVSFASPSSVFQQNATGYGNESTTSKSRTLNWGESIAPCKAHPRATHSDALSVREQVIPKNASSCAEMKGMREAFPTSSTALTSAGVMPASAMALCTGVIMRSSRSWDRPSMTSRVMLDRTSWSSIRHSMESGASGLEERIFFIFSTAMRRRRDARALDLMSIFLLSLNSAQKWSNIAWSNALPPRLRSNAVARIFKPALVKRTTHTCSAECPTSTNTTLCGSSPNSAVLKMPYASAVAVVSCIRRMVLSPAMWHASNMARRCGSVKNTGTDTTASVTFAPWSASAMVFRSLRIIATRRSGVKLFFSPMYCTVIMISSFGPALVGNRNVGKIACTSGSEYRRPISFFRCMIVFLGCMLILSAAAHPMKRCLTPKLTMDGVSRLDSVFSTTSMPLRRARATTLLALPKSRPTTDILLFLDGW
mmetsp:Transcript_14967/g.64135  ORF Transcript_14967/g.64135 Transcript_14967/m.64135 type:complete len:686 (+) Transcript_14967:466-2523(+)